MPEQAPTRQPSPAAVALLDEARKAYGTPAERQTRADEAPDWQHNLQVAAIESAQAQ